MKFKLLFQIAFSLLIARLRQTVVAAVGVTFSITMFITLLSFMGGLNKLLDDLILNRTPHVRLYKEILPTAVQPIDKVKEHQDSYNMVRSIKPKSEVLEIRNSLAILKSLSTDKRVKGVARKTVVPIFYNIGEINLTGVLHGIDVTEERRLFNFDDYVVKGKATDLENVPNGIVLGVGAARKMMVEVGDVIQITTTKGIQFPLKVVGFYQSGIEDIDKVQSYCTISTTQKLMGKTSAYVTDIQINLHDRKLAPAFAKEISTLFQVQALDIEAANAQFDTGSSIRTLISYAVGITLLIVAGFGIYNILNMMIYEKMDSIAILKATGFSGLDVNRIFIVIALSIGLVGGFLGLVLGYGASTLISFIPFDTESLPTVEFYPVDFNPKFYVIGALFSIITTYLAGFFPSRKASRIDPVDIIRGK